VKRSDRCLIVMTKQPIPGQVKTRLAATLGESAAAELYEAFLRDTLNLAEDLPSTDLLISFSPAEADAYYRELAPTANLVAQPDGDLGRRLSNAFYRAFGLGYRRVVVIGSDSPHLRITRLEEAFASVRKGTVVIGPSEDGGYYLLGLGSPAEQLFDEIEWGGDQVFAQTIRQAGVMGLETAVLPHEFDVDTVEDLVKLDAFLRTSQNVGCDRTRSKLRSLPLATAATR
jgi:rSAM/selenodomain-associated transferase 1